MMGSGGLIVMDEDTCMVDVARYFVRFLEGESCGKCTPCREGLHQMEEILGRIAEGDGTDGDIELLEDLSLVMVDTSLCALGSTAPNPVLSTIRYFRDEYEAHITHKRCPAKVCKNLIAFAIDPDKCTGCGACLKACPVDAISGEEKQIHHLDIDKCVKCGACDEACKFEAIQVE
jgi:ferredoxin